VAVDVPIQQSDITYAQTFIKQYLSDHMPEADFSQGTALQDLLVKGFSVMFAFFRSEISKVKMLRSLNELALLPSDEEVDTAIDDVISNLFITRGGGGKSQVTIFITLSRKVDVFVGSSIQFNRDGTHRFVPLSAVSVNKENLIKSVSSTGETVYEFSLVAEAVEIGEEYDIPPGNFVSWDAFNPYVKSVRNDKEGSSGRSVERNETFINRTKDAITVRNLINPRSIRTVLLEMFTDNGLKDVTVIGYGDIEMLRDLKDTQVSFEKTQMIHVGNHQDIYLKLPLLENQTFSGTTTISAKLGESDKHGTLKLPAHPVYKIHSVKKAATGEELSYSLFIRDKLLHYSAYQDSYIMLRSGEDNVNITVTYDSVSGYDAIHQYLINPDERIILANSLARAKIPVYISTEVVYSMLPGNPDVIESTMRAVIMDYIDSVPASDSFAVDNLVKRLHTSFGSSILLKLPLIVKGTVYYPDGGEKNFYSHHILQVPEYLSYGVTTRVCGFFSSESLITFKKV
jgi:hypothetical protein